MEEKEMKCPQCSAKMEKTSGDYRYTDCGLKNIVLKNIDILLCPKCDEEEIVIPNMEQLHNLIALVTASQPSRLLHEEIRFLRSHLGFSGVDFARAIDVTPESISRWETGKEKMSLSMERFLRILILYHFGPFRSYELDLTKYGNISKIKPPKRVFIAKDNQWKEAA